MKSTFRIAVAGNPNCGKTTLFNALTGARQHVGNYPGVTVESKSGSLKLGEATIELIDLPGVYSLSSNSPEEKVAMEEVTRPGIDLILNVIDSSLPQRSFYLTTQLAELHLPMLIVFNMSDEAERKGLRFDLGKLETFFGAPIVRSVGTRAGGVEQLKSALAQALRTLADHGTPRLRYGADVDEAIDVVAAAVQPQLPEPLRHIPARFFAIKLLEKDTCVWAMLDHPAVHAAAEAQILHLRARHAIETETFMADCRYALIAGACRGAITSSQEKRREWSDKIDQVLTHRYLGLPIFLAVMYAMFWLTFTCADPLMTGIESFFGVLGEGVTAAWPAGAGGFLRALTVDGVIGGVGGVIVFLPNILLLFLAIAFLEGTGYMARAAFVMDGVMRKFGLHGKSFVPLVLGFGCTVPAVMATRSIESERDRKTTIMVLPLMSCGARLPIYALIIPAFFAERHHATVMWAIYLIGVGLALIAARLMKSTIFKGDGEVYLMELPPYRMPTIKSLLLHMWERARLYLKKAGSIILLASIVLFCANTFPERTRFTCDYDALIAAAEADHSLTPEARESLIADYGNQRHAEAMEYTLSGRVGKVLGTAFRPLGFDWKVSTALIGSLAAKELFVSQLGILYAVGAADEESLPLREHLQKNYTPLQGFCIMLFCLLSIPCIATIAVVRRELNWRYALAQAAGLLLVAYVGTLGVYWAGSALHLGT